MKDQPHQNLALCRHFMLHDIPEVQVHHVSHRAVGSSFWLGGGGADIEVWKPESSATGARLYRGNAILSGL